MNAQKSLFKRISVCCFALLAIHAMFGFINNESFVINRLNINSPKDLQAYFAYTPDHVPLVSSHRGGAQPSFPEECIATFENTLRYTPSTIEIDPRYTKDSVMVLMHDAVIDRVTNGKGNIADLTWNEVKDLKLKDKNGTLTNYKIQKLDDVLEWAKGKTVVIMDKKTIPIDKMEQKIREHRAEANAMVLVHTAEDAKEYYDRNPNIMIEVEVFDTKKVEELDKSGVPWKNILAYVGFKRLENKELYKMIHKRGSMCLMKAGRVYDKDYVRGDKNIYKALVNDGIDVVETNLPADVAKSINAFATAGSSKSKFFSKVKIEGYMVR